MNSPINPLDLSDIDPLKWAEVRRRADVVRRFLELEKPTAADRGRFAAMLDLGSQQFTNLLKAWNVSFDAKTLSPGGKGREPTAESRSRRGGVDPKAREIAREVIAELGSAAPLSRLVEVVAQRSKNLSLQPPSRMTLWYLAMEAKGAKVTTGGLPAVESILVARAMLKLPIDFGSETGIVFPEVTIAVEAPSGRLIDIAMDHLSGEPAIEFMIGTLRNRSVPIEVDTALVVAMARALPNGAPIIPITSISARKALANLVGRKIGRLELAYKPLVAPPGKFMQSGKDRAPSRADAELALQIASNRHNADLDALHANAV